MDILSHTFSGLAIGTVAAQFTKVGKKHQLQTILFCGLAAFLPDLDVISAWCGFDDSIGQIFSLNERGVEIYHKKHWYSHHALFHSLLMSLVFTVSVVAFQFKRIIKSCGGMQSLLQLTLLAGSVLLSYHAHLWEDMITPFFTWGGVAYLFPSEAYWGGKGYVWWWNNYDLFLIIFSAFVAGTLILFLSWRLKRALKLLALGVLMLAITLFGYQVLQRDFDFQYYGFKGHHVVWTEYETKSKMIQKEILGEKLYNLMEWIDNALPIWF